MGDGTRVVHVYALQSADISHGRYDFPSIAEAFAAMVSRGVAHHDTEVWGQRIGIATGVGTWKLQHGLAMAAQVPASDGPARS